MLPFVPGFQYRRLCLVCGCAFVSRMLWTSDLGSFWTVPLDPPVLHPGRGQPGRDHCCDVHGGAYLWNVKWWTWRIKREGYEGKRKSVGTRKEHRAQQVIQRHQTTCWFSTYGADHFIPQWTTHSSESQKNLTVVPRLHHMSAETWPVVTMVLFPYKV